MESIVKRIVESKYDGVCIETQHGKIRVNHSLDDVTKLFEKLMNNSNRKEIGVSFQNLSSDGISDKIINTCAEKAIAISKEHNYNVSWIPQQPNFLRSLPLQILNTTNDDCFELSPAISVQKFLKSYFKVEFLHGQNRWEVQLDENYNESNFKRLESNVYVRIVKIERGILNIEAGESWVRGVGFIATLNPQSTFERSYINDEKVLGIIRDNKFDLCHELELTDGQKYFGYIVNNGFGSTAIRVRLINDFNLVTFDPFNSSYELGEEKVIQKEAIKGFCDEKTERE